MESIIGRSVNIPHIGSTALSRGVGINTRNAISIKTLKWLKTAEQIIRTMALSASNNRYHGWKGQ